MHLYNAVEADAAIRVAGFFHCHSHNAAFFGFVDRNVT